MLPYTRWMISSKRSKRLGGHRFVGALLFERLLSRRVVIEVLRRVYQVLFETLGPPIANGVQAKFVSYGVDGYREVAFV